MAGRVPRPMPGAVEGFNKMPAELQGMVAIEALRRPGVNWVRVARDTDSGRWLARLQPLPANRDDSSFRLFGRLTRDVGSGVIRRAILAASKDNQTDVKLQVRQTDRQKKGIQFSMDMDTELVFLDFGRGQGGPEAHFRWYEASDPSRANIQRLGNVFSPFKKAAVEYRNSWTSSVGWKASTPFQCWCADPHRTYHKKFKLCPQEVFNMLECFQNLEDFYVVVTKPAQKGRQKPEGYWVDKQLRPPITGKTRRFHGATRSFFECPPECDSKAEWSDAIAFIRALNRRLTRKANSMAALLPPVRWIKPRCGVLLEIPED